MLLIAALFLRLSAFNQIKEKSEKLSRDKSHESHESFLINKFPSSRDPR